MQLFQSDIALMLDAIIFGAEPIPGTDPFTQEGIRNVDGTFNNLLHISPFPDQYGNFIDTDGYGVKDQKFIYQTGQVLHDGPELDIATAGAFELAYEAKYAVDATMFDLSAAPLFTGMVDLFGSR